MGQVMAQRFSGLLGLGFRVQASFGVLLSRDSYCCLGWQGFPKDLYVHTDVYPTPFFGYLVLGLGSVMQKSRYPKEGVGYEPAGKPNGFQYRPSAEDCWKSVSAFGYPWSLRRMQAELRNSLKGSRREP